MKNKIKTYILLVAVLGIWGIIGYKIIFALNPEAPKLVEAEMKTTFTPKVKTVLDTFSIETTDRDPFLGTIHTKNEGLNKRIKKQPATWMPIIYHGNIAGQGRNNNVFIISINGEQQLMKLGQTRSEIKLIRGDKSTVKLSYKGEIKTVTKV